MQSTELYYRKSAAQGATGLGTLIALYETLAGDLRRAAAAERANDIQNRCREVNHALVVIGYLEDCIERASGGELATRLVDLYARLRRNLILAQAKRSPDLLEQQMKLILSIRESWQNAELWGNSTESTPVDITIAIPLEPSPVAGHLRSSWSA